MLGEVAGRTPIKVAFAGENCPKAVWYQTWTLVISVLVTAFPKLVTVSWLNVSEPERVRAKLMTGFSIEPAAILRFVWLKNDTPVTPAQAETGTNRKDRMIKIGFSRFLKRFISSPNFKPQKGQKSV